MRRIHFKTLLACGVASMASTIAQAQESEVPEGDQTNESQNLIIVTGEGVERTLFDTASSVAVLGAAELEELPGPQTVTSVIQQVPNVLVTSGGNDGPTIRGSNTTGLLQGGGAFFGGARPRTTIKIDGREVSFNEFAYGIDSAWDVQRVEVFRGPQTTAQGRNSIAGSINVVTFDPDYSNSAAFRASVGNFDTLQLSGMVNAELVDDQVSLRATMDYREHQSWLTRIDGIEAVDLQGNDAFGDDFLNGKVKLLVEPDALPGLELLFTYSHSSSIAPQNEAVFEPIRERATNVEFWQALFDNKVDAFISDIKFPISDSLTVRNTFTYSDIEIERITLTGLADAQVDQNQYSNELILDYNSSDGSVSGLLGVYYFNLSSDEMIDLTGFGLNPGLFTDSQESFGVFAEATMGITDRLDLTLGLRYQEDSQDRQGGFPDIITLDFDKTFDAWLPRASLTYAVTPDINIGALISRGYNPGGTTISFSIFDQDDYTAEYVTNYELFFRGRFLDGDLGINANLFYSDFEDNQRISRIALVNPDPDGPVLAANITSNVDDARSIGAELAVDWQVNDILDIFAGVGLTDTEVEKFENSLTIVPGNEFQRAPKFTTNFGFALRPIEGMTFSAAGRYTSSYFSDDENTPENKVKGFFVADAQISYETGPFRIFAYGTNIFDNFYITRNFLPFDVLLGDPREYGAGVEVRF